MRSFVLLALVVAASALELTPDNYESATSGKTVFIKFQAPVSPHPPNISCIASNSFDEATYSYPCTLAPSSWWILLLYRDVTIVHFPNPPANLTSMLPFSVVRTLQIHEASLGPAHGRVRGK